MKYPEPGKVKTRLGAEIGPAQAVKFYRVSIEMTFELARKSGLANVLVAFEPAKKAREIEKMLPPGFGAFAQFGNDLGERLIHAFEAAFTSGSQAAIAIGTDSPTLPPEYISQAAASLEKKDLVLGPASDGGYYLIGLRNLQRTLFEGIPWSSDSVLQMTIGKAGGLGLNFDLLPEWYDVDDLASFQQAIKDDATGRLQTLLDTGAK